jgi:hypothetical protein
MVDGVFRRALRSNVRPIELGRRLVHEMDDKRTVDSQGRRIAPNVFRFRLNPADIEQLAPVMSALENELVEAAREYANDEGYHLIGSVAVTLTGDETVKSGRITISSETRDSAAPSGSRGAVLVLPGGKRTDIGPTSVVIGRLPECDVTFDDPNVSRRHAEIRFVAGGWAVADLGSTNGTLVNGTPITDERALRDGDIVSIASHSIKFEVA